LLCKISMIEYDWNPKNMQCTECSPFYDGPEVVLNVEVIRRNSKVRSLSKFGDKLAIINWKILTEI